MGGQPPYPRGLTHYGQADGKKRRDNPAIIHSRVSIFSTPTLALGSLLSVALSSRLAIARIETAVDFYKKKIKIYGKLIRQIKRLSREL